MSVSHPCNQGVVSHHRGILELLLILLCALCVSVVNSFHPFHGWGTSEMLNMHTFNVLIWRGIQTLMGTDILLGASQRVRFVTVTVPWVASTQT